MNLRIVPYNTSHAREWDTFVQEHTVNGTLMHTRKFLNYHPTDRFEDASTMVYHDDKLVCALPVCRTETGFFSHTGASYGGPAVHSEYYRISRLHEIVGSLQDYYDAPLGLRLAPSIFAKEPVDSLVYLFGRHGCVHRELGVYKDLRNLRGELVDSFTRSRMRTSVRKAKRKGFSVEVATGPEDYLTFHEVLTQNLKKHDVSPTHTKEELLNLNERLGKDQMLLVGREPHGAIGASVWVIKVSRFAWDCFYIAKDYEYGSHAAVPSVLLAAMEHAVEAGVPYLNFGICTEDKGQTMNLGLFDFKEALGGSTINRYLICSHGKG